MADENPVAVALDTLRSQRATLSYELAQVNEAITALEKLVHKRANGGGHDPNRKSVRTKLVELLEEGPQDWSAGEIIHEYQRRGDPMQGQDPSNALRAAFADAKKRGMIVSTGVGRYQHAKWAKRSADATPQDTPSSAGSTPSYDPRPGSVTVHSVAHRAIQGVMP